MRAIKLKLSEDISVVLWMKKKQTVTTSSVKGTGHNKFVQRGPTLSGVRVFEDTTYLMNITDKMLLVLEFQLTQKYSASKRPHC